MSTLELKRIIVKSFCGVAYLSARILSTAARAFLMEKRDAEKAEASLSNDRLSESYGSKKLLL